MSILVLAEKEAVLLDAGTGTARLLEKQLAELLEPYERLTVILSHYHLDHVVGLSYLPAVWKQGSLRICAPRRPFVEAEPEDALNKLLSPPLFSLSLGDFPGFVEVLPLTTEDLRIGELRIALRGQNHPGGSMGIRITDSLAYVTDTAVDEATAEFVRGTGLLLHEVWLTDAEAENDADQRSKHSYASGVAQIAAQAAVGKLMPIHHHPRRSHAGICTLAEEMEMLSGIEVTVPQEGEMYHLA